MSNAIILMNNQLKPQQVEMLTQLAKGYRFLTKADLAEGDLEYVEVMYGWDKSYTEAQRQSLKRLKWIQAISAGVDYLPMDIMKNPQIMISNMSGIHATPIAESVFGYLLATRRQFFASQLQQRESNWIRPEHDGYFSLKDKVLLVYGTGNIGQEIARIGHNFSMEVIGINTNGRAIEGFDACYATAEADSIVGNADFIVSTLPATANTRHYFAENWFKRLKATALFINVGRGQTVDETALYEALKAKQIGGAYLDVFHEEPLPESSTLWELENLLISPHISGQIEHFQEETFPIFKENLVSYLNEGKLARNIVAKDKGY